MLQLGLLHYATLEISCTHCLNVNLSHKISGLWRKSTLLKFIGSSWDTKRGYAKVKCFVGVTAPIPIEAFCAIYYKHPEDTHGKICHTVNWCQIKVKRLCSFASKSITKDHSIFLQKSVISGNTYLEAYREIKKNCFLFSFFFPLIVLYVNKSSTYDTT